MHIKDSERATGIAIGDLNLFCRPVVIYAVEQRDILAHLLANLSRIAVVSALVLPESRIDRASVLWQRIHWRVVERCEVEEDKVTRAGVVKSIELLVDAVHVVEKGKTQTVVGEE